MNGAHLHLLINHLPIIGSFLALPLVALALWRNRDLSLLGAAVLVLGLGALGGFGASATGEGAEEVVEEMPAVSESAIHVHEERAELAQVISGLTAALGIGLLVWRVRKAESVPRVALAGLLGASLASAAAMAAVGASGGIIHHPEIREGAQGQGVGAADRVPGEVEAGDEDDD